MGLIHPSINTSFRSLVPYLHPREELFVVDRKLCTRRGTQTDLSLPLDNYFKIQSRTAGVDGTHAVPYS